MNSQTKKIALITGCSSGIGRALAVLMHQQGYHVWATARNLDSISALAEQGISIESLDVTNTEQVNRVIERIERCAGTIDILVNNAGYGAMGPLLETSDEELRRQFDTNVFAPMMLARKVATPMRTKGKGLIVNIGSISGIFATPFSGSYCASKSAINTLSDIFRMEVSPFGIDVLTVQPGAVRSDFGLNATKALDRILPDNSLYKSIEAKLRKRANASQEHPTEVDHVVRTILNRIESKLPGGILRLAAGSKLLPLIKSIVPNAVLDKVLRKMFGLGSLDRKNTL